MYKSEHLVTFRHYLILGVIAFAAGIFLATNCNAVTLFTAIVFILAVFVVLVAALTIKLFFKSERLKHILLPIFLIFCVLAGSARILVPGLLSPSPLEKHLNSQAWLTGTVVSRPTLTDKGWSYYFEFEVAQLNDKRIDPENIIVYIPQKQGASLTINDQICCWTTITKPKRDEKLDNYDFHTYLRGKSIFFIGNVKNANPVKFEKSFTVKGAIKDFGRYANIKICNTIDALFKTDTRSATLLKGILVGETSGFSDETYEKYSYSGLSHIVSVSGMHLSILYTFLVSFLNAIRIRRRYAALIILPLLLIFTSTASFAPSACRAALMYLIMMLAYLFKRRYSPMNALFFSLGVILISYPYSLYSKSLALSFSAVLGIHLFFSYAMGLSGKFIPFKEHKFPSPKILIRGTVKSIFSSFITSFSVCVGTFFFSTLFFGKLSYIQFFTNLWVVPVVSVAFVLGYVACIINMLYPPFAGFLCIPLGWCLKIISSTADIFGKQQYTLDISSKISTLSLFIIYSGIVLIIYMTLKTWHDMQTEKKLKASKKPMLH